MTPEAQRIAIAEACGWKNIVTTIDYRKELVGINTHLMRLVHRGQYVESVLPIPDYLNDLNAMHEAEKILSEVQRAEFLERLSNLCEFILPSRIDWHCCHALAAQRAEAFLRTTGKWTDHE